MPTYTTRHYSLTDSDLLFEADRKLEIVKRDWSHFLGNTEMQTAHKATYVAKTALVVAIERARFSMRFMLRIEMLAEEMRQLIQRVEGYLEKAAGVKNLLLTQHREKLSQLNEERLLASAIAVVRKARYFEENNQLTEEGIETLNNLSANCSEFEEMLKQKVSKQIERAVAEEECTHLGNLLYDRLNFLCHVGKRRFFIADWDRYRDYLLPEENLETVNRLIQLNFGSNESGTSQAI